jgi:hypothetical protein
MVSGGSTVALCGWPSKIYTRIVPSNIQALSSITSVKIDYLNTGYYTLTISSSGKYIVAISHQYDYTEKQYYYEEEKIYLGVSYNEHNYAFSVLSNPSLSYQFMSFISQSIFKVNFYSTIAVSISPNGQELYMQKKSRLFGNELLISNNLGKYFYPSGLSKKLSCASIESSSSFVWCITPKLENYLSTDYGASFEFKHSKFVKISLSTSAQYGLALDNYTNMFETSDYGRSWQILMAGGVVDFTLSNT